MSDDPVTVTDLQVSGGAGGTEANLEDIRALAGTSMDLSGQLAQITAAAHTVLLDPDLLASAVLCPGTAAAATTALLDALDGPSGLTWLSARLATRSTVATLSADAYEASDAAQAALVTGWEWFEGASGLQYAEVLLTLAGPVLPGGMAVNPAAAVLWTNPELWLTEHPEMVDDLINSAPGMLTTFPGAGLVSLGLGGLDSLFTVQGATGIVARAFPDSDYSIRPRSAGDGLDPAVNTDVGYDFHPPAGVADLIADLDHRNGQSDADSDIIDVQVLTAPDGSTSAVVNIPGTHGGLNFGEAGASPNDFNTNLHALAGETTAREQAIADAVHQALGATGADPDTPVMLVGHSQGGMVAAQAAADADALGINVTHVLTAGSPVALADVPPDVQVLSVENSHDIVPHLDGSDNSASANQTTVTFDDQDGSIGANHSLSNGYTEAAAAIDESTDPSITAYLDSAAAFLPGSDADLTVQAYELDRQ